MDRTRGGACGAGGSRAEKRGGGPSRAEAGGAQVRRRGRSRSDRASTAARWHRASTGRPPSHGSALPASEPAHARCDRRPRGGRARPSPRRRPGRPASRSHPPRTRPPRPRAPPCRSQPAGPLAAGGAGRTPTPKSSSSDVRDSGDGHGTVAQQAVGALGHAGRDAAGHRGHRPAEVARELGGDQAAARIGRLDHDRHAGQPGHDAVPGGEAPAVRAGTRRKLREHEPGPGHMPVKGAMAQRVGRAPDRTRAPRRAPPPPSRHPR